MGQIKRKRLNNFVMINGRHLTGMHANNGWRHGRESHAGALQTSMWVPSHGEEHSHISIYRLNRNSLQMITQQ